METLRAEAIEVNIAEVEEAILIIRSALDNSVNWDDLELIVKEEQKAGDAIAGLISKLKVSRPPPASHTHSRLVRF